MLRLTTPWACLFLVLSCADPRDPSTPKGAFATIAKCIDRVDRKCFFETLDRDSRWSVATIHRTLVEIRAVAEKSYPENMKKTALGVYAAEAEAKTPQEMFALFCKKRKCLEEVARGYGAIQQFRRISSDRVEVTTSRGKTFQMAHADGRWGLDILSQELHRTKIRLIDRLEQVRENARQFDEQRLAREGEQ